MLIFFSASFYGSSFVSLPLQDAKSSTDISFKFRTSRPESLLFLVAGKTDYCLIMLQQGIVKVIKCFFCGKNLTWSKFSNSWLGSPCKQQKEQDEMHVMNQVWPDMLVNATDTAALDATQIFIFANLCRSCCCLQLQSSFSN